MVKLAKDPLDPHDIDQPRAEWRDERVKTLHTEMCEKSDVTSVEEGYDVERVIVPQNDETAGILKQLNGETSADLTALEKKGLDRRTDHQAETQPRSARPTPWRDKHATIEYGRKSKRICDRDESMLWLAASYLVAPGYKP